MQGSSNIPRNSSDLDLRGLFSPDRSSQTSIYPPLRDQPYINSPNPNPLRASSNFRPIQYDLTGSDPSSQVTQLRSLLNDRDMEIA